MGKNKQLKMQSFKKIYTRVTQLTKATCTLEATGVGNEEMAMVDGKSAQVIKINGRQVTLQVFAAPA